VHQAGPLRSNVAVTPRGARRCATSRGGSVMAARSWSWSPRWFAPVVLTLAIVGGQSAAASGPPEPSNGTFGRTGPPAAVAVRTADGNTILSLTARPGRFTGTFSGEHHFQ